MRRLESAFITESFKRGIRVHVQIAAIRPHVTCNKSRRVKSRRIAVFDSIDVGSFDLQLALHIQQAFAKCCTLSAHDVAQTQFKSVKPLWVFGFIHLNALRLKLVANRNRRTG